LIQKQSRDTIARSAAMPTLHTYEVVDKVLPAVFMVALMTLSSVIVLVATL